MIDEQDERDRKLGVMIREIYRHAREKADSSGPGFSVQWTDSARVEDPRKNFEGETLDEAVEKALAWLIVNDRKEGRRMIEKTITCWRDTVSISLRTGVESVTITIRDDIKDSENFFEFDSTKEAIAWLDECLDVLEAKQEVEYREIPIVQPFSQPVKPW